MAAESETVNIQQTEAVVNRWLVDYYLFLAFDYLEKEQYKDFFALREVLDSILDRPLEASETTPTKIKILQFIYLINYSEQHDVDPNTDPTVNPLESALKILQSMEKDCSTHDYDKVCSSLKEMIVKTFVANDEIGKAKKAVNKYFTKSLIDKKSLYMGVINQKSSVRETMDQIDISQFKKEMLNYCRKLCKFTNCFLFRAAVRLFASRHSVTDDDVEEPAIPAEPEQTCSKRILLRQCNRVFIEKSRLEAGFNELTDEKRFSQLQEEEEQAQIQAITLHLSPSLGDNNEELNNHLSLKTADSPKEASPADEPPQMCDVSQPQTSSRSIMETAPSKRQKYTIAQLVVEPDGSSVSQKVHHEHTSTEMQEKSPARSESFDNTQSPISECEVSRPVRKRSFKSCDRAKAISQDKTALVRNKDCSDSDESAVSTFRDAENGHVEVQDGLDSSPSPLKAAPQTSSTPDKNKSNSKWKKIFSAAKESKDVWSDEDELFDNGSPNRSLFSNGSQRKRPWTDIETNQLKQGVERFGEGQWCKIKAYYKFKDRTNVNLKDRWRTMKKLKMV